MYHVMSRGNRREKIFLDDVDRQDFIKTLAEVCQKTGWQVHAYCLMPTHYHLVLETPEPNLVAGMAWGNIILGNCARAVRKSRRRGYWRRISSGWAGGRRT